jgi:serine/threonine-protein kinase
MELLQGETLRERLARLDPKRNPAAREQLLDLFDRLLEPLAAAHQRGIVHRDLKPENVFVHRRRDGSEVVKVLDFGIARELDTAAPSVTQTGIAMGTPHYMSPEQAMNARDATFPADVWSLGAMLYEILSGETPFPGETAGSIIAAAVTEAHRPIGTVAPGTPPELSQLLDRCLAKRAQDRPRDAAVLLAELRRARGRAAPPVVAGAMTPAPVSPIAATSAAFSPATGPMTGHMSPVPSSTGTATPLGGVTGSPSMVPATVGHPGGAMQPTAAMQTPTGPALDLARNVGTPPAAIATALPSSPGLGTPAPALAASSSSNASRTWLLVGAGAVLTLFGGGLCCLGGVFGLGLMGGGDGETETLADGPITWTGELAASDRMEGSRYYDTFAFEALPGQRFTVELSSSAFDPILRLGTPSGQSMENDDTGFSLNSRIDVPSAEAGTYTVHVTTFDSAASGAYLVLVHQ